MKIGFIGLGGMGSGMAMNLLKGGHDVTLYNRTRAKAEALIDNGAKVADTISQACQAEAVCTMLAMTTPSRAWCSATVVCLQVLLKTRSTFPQAP
jgi:3-hydroxyisobutyrate dehydrogenase-like beta-hydroxyacid dehydrogenase